MCFGGPPGLPTGPSTKPIPTAGPMNPIDTGGGGGGGGGKPYPDPMAGDPVGGSPAPKAPSPPPENPESVTGNQPASAPVFTPGQEALPSMDDPNPAETAAQRLKRLRSLRQGLLSTIKTSAQGTQAPPMVSTPGLYATGTKGKLGQ